MSTRNKPSPKKPSPKKPSPKASPLKSTVDGGQVALKGFVVQSMAALLDALEDIRVETIEIEPDGAELSNTNPSPSEVCYEKVDYCLYMTDGCTRAVQVKCSKNPISTTDTKKWADELISSKSAREYELQIFAPSAGGLVDGTLYNGVKIRHNTGNVPVLWDAVSCRAARQIQSHRGHYHMAAISDGCRAFVGEVLVRATERKRWRRAELLGVLIAHVEAHSQLPMKTALKNIDVELRWVVIGHTNRRSEEHVKCTFKKRGSGPRRLPWTVVWTDADNVEVIRVSDGITDSTSDGLVYHEVVDTTTGALEVQVVPRWDIEPNESQVILISVRRDPAFDLLPDGTWLYKNPFLATLERCVTEVLVKFPREGSIEAAGAIEKDSQCVRWTLITGSEQRQVTAVARPTNLPFESLPRLRAHIDDALAEHEAS